MEPPSIPDNQIQVYTRRWFILFVVCILNFSNALLWICFASVANFTDAYYCNDPHDCGAGAANLLSAIFMVIAIPVGFLAMYSVDKFGLRSGILIGSWVNLTGALIRIFSSTPFIPRSSRLPIALTGQSIAACAQPFIMYLPTKTAALWFPESQRAIANTLGSMANPLGIMVATLVAPFIVRDPKYPPPVLDNWLLLLNLIMTVPAVVAALFSTIGVCSSRPPKAPSSSALQQSEAFWPGLKRALKSKPFMILVFALGGGMGIFNAMYTLMEQILCARGYSNFFAGLCGALLILGGISGAVVSGIIVDKTKAFEETIKVSLSVGVVIACGFAVLSLYRNMAVGIGLLCFFFGAFGFAAYPVGLECGVECTYPTAEATSSGLVIISGQIQGLIYVVVMSVLESDLSPYDALFQTCSSESGGVEPKNMTVPNMVLAGCGALLAVVVTIFFRPVYKRIEAEKKSKLAGKNGVMQTPTPSLWTSTTVGSTSTIAGDQGHVMGDPGSTGF